ncbi:MAG TPA: polysaccharide biosynthesis/export family protein [Caulobacteraceae bacterium]|jgi:polysaccharide export outer membrane protein|nr:polysaccharide biosynthesis/export family protein [Caulobacteraceae bacterium]
MSRKLIGLAGVAVGLAWALGGCSSFPDDGPSSHAVAHGAAPSTAAQYALVDLDYRSAQLVAATPPTPLAGLAGGDSDAAHDRIAAGDVLQVQIIEPGAAGLFSPREAGGPPAPGSLDHAVVGDGGDVQVPYAGLVRVAGLTPDGATAAICRALQGRVYDPQVTVTVLSSAANSVTVIGEVRTAGRFGLTPSSDHLLDVVAEAGGPTKEPGDLEVVVVRGAQSLSAPLNVLLNEPGENVRLAPGDQVRLLYRPRKFSTFGALGKSQQISIEDDQLTLAGAISRTGGLSSDRANPNSVLLFRFERPEVAARLGITLPPTPKGVPVVYRLNLRDPSGYLIANSFDVEGDDLIYVPTSDVAELRKFLDLVNTVTQVGYNVRVTSVLQ